MCTSTVPGLALAAVAPDVFEQHVARKHGALVFHQQRQQLIFLERELDGLTGNADRMRALVERDGAVGKQNVLGGRNGVLRAAEYGAYTRDKLHHAEGLCDVVIRAAVQTDDLVVLGVFRGQKDDRERGGVGQATKTAQDGNAVLAGEHDVEQDEVGFSLRRAENSAVPSAKPRASMPVFCRV